MDWEREVEAQAMRWTAYLNDVELLIYATVLLEEVLKRGYLREFKELLERQGGG